MEDLDALAKKLKAECERHSPAVVELEGKVKELEENSTTMTPAEASKAASNITHEIEASAVQSSHQYVISPYSGGILHCNLSTSLIWTFLCAK